jgi:flavodoxin
MNTHTPTALVVHESMFHNTADIAEAIAGGLAEEGVLVSSADVADAPTLDSVDVDLLVVGAPTHAFSLSRPSTREDAVRQGAPAERAGTGVREWFEAAHADKGRHRLAAMFDTRVTKVRKLPKAAGTRGGHVLKRIGFTLVERPEPFLVDDVQGPLVEGEIERATEWGRALARDLRERLAVSA